MTKEKRYCLKKIITLIVCFSVFLTATKNVYGKESLPDTKISEKRIESQNYYDGYNLEWSYREGFVWDLLMSVSTNEGVLATYEYDESEFRSKKITSDGITEFKYSEDGRLLYVDDSGKRIDYYYLLDPITQTYTLEEMVYDSERYSFIFDGETIQAIMRNDSILAEYCYNEFGEFVCVLDFSSGDGVVNDDPSFIGNLNKLRLNTAYYDEETGWYYKTRYFDPKEYRFIDGISYEQALDMMAENDSLEMVTDALLRVNTMGCYKTAAVKQFESQASMFSTSYSQLETVARIIYFESGTRGEDWYDVAKVIYNRMQLPDDYGGSSAYDVVTYRDAFTAYISNRYTDDVSINSDRWKGSVQLSLYLDLGQFPTDSHCHISSQTNFRNLLTFYDGYSLINGIPYFEGDMICNVFYQESSELWEGMSKSYMYDNFVNHSDAGHQYWYNVFFDYSE